jgi:hypothetical protein
MFDGAAMALQNRDMVLLYRMISKAAVSSKLKDSKKRLAVYLRMKWCHFQTSLTGSKAMN